MSPSSPAHDSVALLRAKAIFHAKLGERYAALGVSGAEFYDLLVGQFRARVSLSPRISEPVKGMKNVLLMRNPLEIFYMIIRWVVVDVVHLAFWRRLGDKCDCDKLVNERFALSPISAKLNTAMSVLSFAWHQNSKTASTFISIAKTSYVPRIRDFIKSFKPGNWLPSFLHTYPSDREIF